MKQIRTKANVIELAETLKGIEFPHNAYVMIRVTSGEFDELVVRGLGKAINMDTINYLHDGKVYQVIRDAGEEKILGDSNHPELFL